jgi:anti-sigma B factor antagonist
MEFPIEITEDEALIYVEGDLDTAESAKLLTQAFASVFDKGAKVVVLDFSGVQLINSYGIGKLVMFHKKLKQQGREMRIRATNAHIRETFELLTLDKLFDIED